MTAVVGHAQTPADDARLKLEASKRALTDKDRVAGELQSELARLKQDREHLAAQLVQTAKLIQASEAQLSAIEQRRGELEAQEALVRGSLEKKSSSLSGLLAAMQRMGRNPPPVMVTRREDALAMVRSAKLLAASAPEMAAQANALADQLTDLVRIMSSIRLEEDKLRGETQRLSEAQTRLAALQDIRRQTVTDRQTELAQVKRATTELRQNITDLGELLGRLDKLDKEVSERTRLGAYEKELAAAEARKAAEQAASPPPAVAAAPKGPDFAPKSVTTTEIRPDLRPADKQPDKKGDKQVAAAQPAPPPASTPKVALPPVELKPSITLAPSDRMAMASPGRLQPSIPFVDARGRLPLPAQGRRVYSYGERTQGDPFKGIAIETRFGAQVTSPADGWVVYAGEFRRYGQILIINAGGGYHILLANLTQLDAVQGQFVLAGEPVGTMAPAPKGATSGRGQEGAPILYVEFRKDQKPIDPGPWWADPGKKNASLPGGGAFSPQFPPG